MSSDEEMPDKLKTAIDTLRQAGSVPPSATWEYLVEWEGDDATEALIEVMRDGDQPAIHAVRILAERGDAASIGPMIALLIDGEPDKLLRDEITFACHKFGESALDPLLEAYDEAEESGEHEVMLTLLEAAFETGVTNRRLSEALATQVAHDPAVVRRMLPEYEAADEVVEILEERAAAIPERDEAERPDGEAIQAIWNTIKQMGGEIPDELRGEMQPTASDGPKNAAEAYIQSGWDDADS